MANATLSWVGPGKPSLAQAPRGRTSGGEECRANHLSRAPKAYHERIDTASGRHENKRDRWVTCHAR